MSKNISALELLYFLKLYNIPLSENATQADNSKNISSSPINNIKIKNISSSPAHDIIIKNTRKLLEKINNLDELIHAIKNFNECSLKADAKHDVIFDGNARAKIMLIGEAPGSEEDELGIPFCGQSGQLLDNMLKSIGLDRKSNVYITNIIFWRPPENRKPNSEEIELCRPFVEKHISLINPELIITIGASASASLLGKGFEITKMRRQYFEYSNIYLNKKIPVTAIFHPAYLMRQSSQKKNTWYDLIEIQDYIAQNLKNHTKYI